IGLVVDDAIVVLENISRHVESGLRPMQAAIKGTREIGFAVLAMTLTLTAVYAPIASATGRTGRLFLEFALALAGAVLVSGFVALTLTPMLCSKLLRHNESPGRLFTMIENGLRNLERGYRRALETALSVKWLVIALGLVTAGAAGALFLNLKSELSPVEDRGVILIRGSGPEGATLSYMARYSAQADAVLAELPE